MIRKNIYHPQQRERERERESEKQVQLTGCRCEYRPKELGGEGRVWELTEGDLKDEDYNKDKDLVACPQCSQQDKYKNFPKKEFGWWNEVGKKEHRMIITIIYGAKKNESSRPKCMNCDREQGYEDTGTGRTFWVSTLKNGKCDYCLIGDSLPTCSKCQRKVNNLTDLTDGKCWNCITNSQGQSGKYCEECKADCYDKTTGCTSFLIITHYYTDFTKKVWFFGMNYSCAEKFKQKRENQQDCSQCKKTEWPDMAKGWLLDYGLKKAFCSPECHCAYRKVDIDKINDKDLSEQVILFPPQLEITDDVKDKNFNLEQEAEKKEILYLRETVKELQKQLEESKNKPPNQQKPNEVPHQQRQISYLLKLHQNTQQKAEKNYQNKYGKSELDKLSSSDQPKGNETKPTNWTPWIIGGCIIGGLLIIGVIIYFFVRKRKNFEK